MKTKESLLSSPKMPKIKENWGMVKAFFFLFSFLHSLFETRLRNYDFCDITHYKVSKKVRSVFVCYSMCIVLEIDYAMCTEKTFTKNCVNFHERDDFLSFLTPYSIVYYVLYAFNAVLVFSFSKIVCI